MTTERSGSENDDQIDFWNSAPGRKWTLFQEDLDTFFQSVTDRLIELAVPGPGERIVDIGCGTGATTMALAARTGPGGSVLGVDVSRPLLDHASGRAAADGVGNVEFLLADAQAHDFDEGRFDLLASRFGVMFFSDPVAAFANMRKALGESGRICFAAWASLAKNPWFGIPRDAAVARLGEPAAVPPGTPGPLAFADADRVLGILEHAGYSDCTVSVEEVGLFHPGGVGAAARLGSNIGPGARIVAQFGGTEEDVANIAQAVLDGFRQYAVDGGVRVPATVNFFTARR